MKGITKITYKDIEFEVEYDFTPIRYGIRTLSNGDPGYPDTPAELDIEAIKFHGVDIYEVLSQEIIDKIEELTFNKVEHQ